MHVSYMTINVIHIRDTLQEPIGPHINNQWFTG